MSPLEIDAIFTVGSKLWEAYQAHQAMLAELKARDPAAYAQIEARHAAVGHRLDAAAAP